MADRVVSDGRGELRLDRDDSTVVAFDDQIDSVLPGEATEMSDTRFGCMRIDAHVECDEGLGERAGKRSVGRDGGGRLRPVEEPADPDVKEACGERRIDELVLGRRS